MLINNKIFSLILLCILSFTLLTGCRQKERTANELVIGTMAGPESELMRVAQTVAEKQYNLKIRIVEFEDYVTPNAALAEGSIDANLFQHAPYLAKTIQVKGYKLVEIGREFIYPMGLYSNRIKKLSDLPTQGSVAIPVDPSNAGRALLLLQEAKLITLDPTAGLYPTPKDIKQNPKQLKIKELEAAILPRMLKDVDLAAINTNYAIPAGLMPSQDALFLEHKDSPYANILVVRLGEESQEKYQKLLQALHSKEVVEEANKLFSGQAVPAW